jgi:hypothetical protein
MRRSRVLLVVLACAALAGLAPSAAAAKSVKLPARVGGALGLVPRHGDFDIAAGTQTPVVFHGGSVMRGPSGVTLHTIYWVPPGFELHAGYKAFLDRFFTDVAADSGATTNVFSVLPQFADAGGAGQYRINFNAATDSIVETNPFPTGDNCASANGIPTCLTDHQVQAEVDNVIQAGGLPRGLADIYMVLLPQNVDTCILPGICGTNAFGGYHSVSDLGHGTTIYANIPDPTIAGTLPDPATFPNGNADAEIATDVVAHETVEAITDPVGTGWMDPNGFEVADKCEFGPVLGTALGQAANGADFNQLINGHQYLIQEMWSNDDAGCVQQTALTASPLPLAQVNLGQFGSAVSGNIGTANAVHVTVSLVRAGTTVMSASTVSDASGAWSASLAPFSVGDDRDEIDVAYDQADPGAPPDDTILTGNGGDPNDEAGWTGWGDIDTGTSLAPDGSAVAIFPCFQTGVLALAVNGTGTPVGVCDTESDVSVTPLSVGAGDAVTMHTNDNRAFSPDNGNGALVDLGIALGEPGGAFPTCNADLEPGNVTCSGLVPGATYTLTRSRGAAHAGAAAGDDGSLTAHFAGAPALAGGDTVALRNAAGRLLTTLHIAHLRVDIAASQSVIASGRCQPGDYFGAFTIAPTLSDSAGGPGGPAGTGTICPLNGDATGLPSDDVEQTDDASGGQTQTHVPDVENTSPMNGETLFGRFLALAQPGLPGPNNAVALTRDAVGLTIVRVADGAVVFRAANVNTAAGVSVPGLRAGTYTATWVVHNQNGDTRTVRTRFVQSSVGQGAGAGAGKGHKHTMKATCRLSHGKVRCKLSFPRDRSARGTVRARLARGGRIVALGRARMRRGRATVVLQARHRVRRGRARLTVVATRLGTIRKTVRVR